MTTSHMTPRILVAVTVAAIAVSSPRIAQRVAEPELLLREALHKQQVQGDPPGAIKIYQQIVSARSGDRAVTARAARARRLLREARAAGGSRADETIASPPKPIAIDSAAAHNRRVRSLSSGPITTYLAISVASRSVSRRTVQS